jgi:DNA replication and repair protein RecF
VGRAEGRRILQSRPAPKTGPDQDSFVPTIGFRVTRQRDWAGTGAVGFFFSGRIGFGQRRTLCAPSGLNAVLAQVDGTYADGLARYTKLLEERNAALRRIRDGLAKPGSLEPWDLSLLTEGTRLTLARSRFMEEFAPRVQERQAALSSGRDRGTAHYRPSFHVPAADEGAVTEANRARFSELRDGEIALGSTLIGPHRDDVEFRLDDDLAKVRASQGQARTLALAWKWEERRLLQDG